EVLRVGQGMEDQADYIEHSITTPLKDPQGFVDVLRSLDQEGLLSSMRVSEEEGLITGVILEKPGPALTVELEAKQPLKAGAYMAFIGGMLRLWNITKDALDRTFQMMKERAGPLMAESYPARGPAKFFDILSECLIFVRVTNEAELKARMTEHMEKF